MKKTYIKPSLQMEKFAVESIMTQVSDILGGKTLLDLGIELENGGDINFSDGNTLQSIDYKAFLL
ncbi:MAG: hypothetical protein J6C82_04150 [Clostridia bacterium]|nr:hypothetical protein [Clostridia bacterium]